jgi:hypothetical protein
MYSSPAEVEHGLWRGPCDHAVGPVEPDLISNRFLTCLPILHIVLYLQITRVKSRSTQ